VRFQCCYTRLHMHPCIFCCARPTLYIQSLFALQHEIRQGLQREREHVAVWCRAWAHCTAYWRLKDSRWPFLTKSAIEASGSNVFQPYTVRSLAVLTCECSETCIMAMHVFCQGDLIGIAQFDLDQHQNISSPHTECKSLLSLCPYIKHILQS
jgi:hypothetical protein